MKRVTEHLLREHELIERLLDCLERMMEETRRTDELDAVAAVELVRFFDVYVDGLHQDKEELHLFPALRRRACAVDVPLIEQLLHEHKAERTLIDALRANLEAAAYGDPFSRDVFVHRARQYATLVRAHLRQENAVLLPLAERMLTAADDRETCAGCERIAALEPTLARYRRVAAALEERSGGPVLRPYLAGSPSRAARASRRPVAATDPAHTPSATTSRGVPH